MKQWSLLLLGTAVILVGEGMVIINGGPWYYAVFVFTIALVCFGIVGRKEQAQRIETHFAGRPILGEEAFGQHYFPAESVEIATKIRKILTSHVGIDISRMNPADRLNNDLHMDDFDSMATVEFIIEIEKEFGIQIPNEAAEKINTFRDVVDYVAKAVESKAN